jgi:electron transport complex protein RnfB
MLGLAIVLGVLIVLFPILFHVEEDPRVAAVEKMLPNYNCGACGKAGCHDMAEALVSGEVKNVSKCKVGKKDKNYDPIIAYLASTPGPDGKTVEVNI